MAQFKRLRKQLEDFEAHLDTIGVEDLKLWQAYWADLAQQVEPKVRERATRMVHDIERAINQKTQEGPDAPTLAMPDSSQYRSFDVAPTEKGDARAGRIVYIECKAGDLTGPARIGRVTFSKTGRTLYYRGHKFRSLKGAGFKSNYYDVDTGEDYWISGPKREGFDRLYGERTPVEIDDDVREEYWRDIRRQPERIHERLA